MEAVLRQTVCMTEPLVGAISLPDGTLIRGRGRREREPGGPLPDFGLGLGRPPGTGGSAPGSGQARRARIRRRPAPPPEWPVAWIEWPVAWIEWPVAWIDWPDFRTPRHGQLAAIAIEHAYALAKTGQRVEVNCGGGTGRTGTVIACMAVLAGCPAAEAVAWTRRHYRSRAVETPGQRRWIEWFASHGRTR